MTACQEALAALTERLRAVEARAERLERGLRAVHGMAERASEDIDGIRVIAAAAVYLVTREALAAPATPVTP